MANRRALVVGFETGGGPGLRRLRPFLRTRLPDAPAAAQIKRRMFTCTQCQQCVQACDRVDHAGADTRPAAHGVRPLRGRGARAQSERSVMLPEDCFGKTD